MNCYFRKDDNAEKPIDNTQAVDNAKKIADDARKAADMVLHPKRWKGQEYGSGTEAVVHTRHLRTLCDRFSTGKNLKFRQYHVSLAYV